MVEVISHQEDSNLKALDLGCGTGILTKLLLQRFSNAHVKGFDITKQMLEEYKLNLQEFKHQVEAIKGDFKTDFFGLNYDIILTGLTLHHLNAEQRKKIFQKIYNSLAPDGIFVTRDIIVGESIQDTNKLYEKWKKFMRENDENAEAWYQKHLEKDFPQSITELTSWLKDVGFSRVTLQRQDNNFVVISAVK